MWGCPDVGAMKNAPVRGTERGVWGEEALSA
jgi:hypothetical protein